jgi:hypothetical protein
MYTLVIDRNDMKGLNLRQLRRSFATTREEHWKVIKFKSYNALGDRLFHDALSQRARVSHISRDLPRSRAASTISGGKPTARELM